MSVSNPDLSTLQGWLQSLLGEEVPDWEVTPHTVGILSSLYHTNTRMEKCAELQIEMAEQERVEYEGEAERLRKVLDFVGGDDLVTGPTQAYTEVVTDLCHILDLDSSLGSGLETRLANLMVSQAEVAPSRDLEKVRSNTVELYSLLGRLGEVCEKAVKEARAEDQISINQIKKLEFTLEKCRDYRRVVEKGESQLARNGALDLGLRHGNVERLSEELEQLTGQLEPLQRELEGYVNLPPSLELASLEVSKCRDLLENLEDQVASAISSLHI